MSQARAAIDIDSIIGADILEVWRGQRCCLRRTSSPIVNSEEPDWFLAVLSGLGVKLNNIIS